MQNRLSLMFNKLSLLVTLLITVYVSKVRAEECGHEELNKCAKSLQALKSATDLSFAPKREELAELCPDLDAGLKCIRSYTRRCMTLQQRQQFMKIYKGTDDVIRDLCREGDYQNEFLKHSQCLRTVKPAHKKCEEKYQETMLSLKTPKANHTMQSEQQTEQNTNDDVRKVCCSFREYLDCSEDVTRRTCGAETGTFIRGFLKKMSSTLEKDYCEEYYKQGVNQCPNIFSSGSSLVATSTVVKSVLLSLLMVMVNLR